MRRPGRPLGIAMLVVTSAIGPSKPFIAMDGMYTGFAGALTGLYQIVEKYCPAFTKAPTVGAPVAGHGAWPKAPRCWSTTSGREMAGLLRGVRVVFSDFLVTLALLTSQRFIKELWLFFGG